MDTHTQGIESVNLKIPKSPHNPLLIPKTLMKELEISPGAFVFFIQHRGKIKVKILGETK